MKPFFFMLSLFISSPLWAQVYPVPPVNESEAIELKNCEQLLTSIKKDEKTFVEGEKKKYRSEKDFFKVIEQRIVSDSIKKISKDGLAPKVTKCSEEELSTLVRIRDHYNASRVKRCHEFNDSDRWNHIERLEKLISINEE